MRVAFIFSVCFLSWNESRCLNLDFYLESRSLWWTYKKSLNFYPLLNSCQTCALTVSVTTQLQVIKNRFHKTFYITQLNEKIPHLFPRRSYVIYNDALGHITTEEIKGHQLHKLHLTISATAYVTLSPRTSGGQDGHWGRKRLSTSMMHMKKPHNAVMGTDHGQLCHAAGKLSDTVCCVDVQGPSTPKRCIHVCTFQSNSCSKLISLKSKQFICTVSTFQLDLDVHQSYILLLDAFMYLKYRFSFNYD